MFEWVRQHFEISRKWLVFVKIQSQFLYILLVKSNPVQNIHCVMVLLLFYLCCFTLQTSSQVGKRCAFSVTLHTLLYHSCFIFKNLDIVLGVKYLNAGYFEWGILTLMLSIVPSILIQCVSLRWYKVDQKAVTLSMALSHFSLLGIVYR